jgi:hypothetical protein
MGLRIEIGYGQLQAGGERYPEKIRDVYVDQPTNRGRGVPDRDERPDQRSKNEQDIYRRQKIIFQPELKGRKREVENQVQCERQCADPGNFFFGSHPKYPAKGNCD